MMTSKFMLQMYADPLRAQGRPAEVIGALQYTYLATMTWRSCR
ncbi:hypothetical protein PATSB16_01930 [Pandoraea thiooxydans]|nr:hypothetical protein PATSB16_01930 [Pandoraea thiooxydans]